MKIRCVKCGCEVEVPITIQQYVDWKFSGNYIQNEFPELTAGQREMLLSGICEKCWNLIFNEEENGKSNENNCDSPYFNDACY